jgi:DNA adenine methylase
MQYPGGKGTAYQKIINLIPPHTTYIESHLGGGAVMAHKAPARLNIGIDINPIVLSVTAESIAPDSPVVSSEGAGSLELARLASIAGNGEFSVTVRKGDARGEHRQIERYQMASPEMGVRDLIAGNGGPSGEFRFVVGDAVAFLEGYRFTGGEFVYSDPPYVMSSRKCQRPLYAYEYDDVAHERLLAALLLLPCPVAISGYWSELYADVLAGWHTYTFTSQTRGGTPAEEWLWMNYPRPDALHEYTYLGEGFRERERIKRKKDRWLAKLRRMPRLERQAILWAISEGV